MGILFLNGVKTDFEVSNIIRTAVQLKIAKLTLEIAIIEN